MISECRVGVLSMLLLMGAGETLGQGCEDLRAFSGLLGHWRTDDGLQQESWQQVSEFTLEGSNQSVDGLGRSVSAEAMRLVAMGGAIYYLAKVDHNPLPIAFKLTECETDRWVFLNPIHDFPTRLIYRQVDAKTLQVQVLGESARRVQRLFRRVSPAAQ